MCTKSNESSHTKYRTEIDQSKHKGEINLIIGPMYSGKSSELIRRFNRHKIGGKKCIMIKQISDTRYDATKVTTHDKIMEDAYPCKYLYEIDELIRSFDVICIDEIQFFEDAFIFCDKWANENKIIEACGLSGTYRLKPFDVITKLIPLAKIPILHLSAVCKYCGEDASCSRKFVGDDVVIDIGGEDKYEAVCMSCYFKMLPHHQLFDYKLEKFKIFLDIYEPKLSKDDKENIIFMYGVLYYGTNDTPFKTIVDNYLKEKK